MTIPVADTLRYLSLVKTRLYGLYDIVHQFIVTFLMSPIRHTIPSRATRAMGTSPLYTGGILKGEPDLIVYHSYLYDYFLSF
jgi:hypothetical protein